MADLYRDMASVDVVLDTTMCTIMEKNNKLFRCNMRSGWLCHAFNSAMGRYTVNRLCHSSAFNFPFDFSPKDRLIFVNWEGVTVSSMVLWMIFSSSLLINEVFEDLFAHFGISTLLPSLEIKRFSLGDFGLFSGYRATATDFF
jgi:hypothetical protein